MAARTAPGARFAALSRLREWLGTAPDGSPWLSTTAWRLHPGVSCDWTDFQELYRLGMNAPRTRRGRRAARALDLVRGGPFLGAHHLYPWAEPFRQDMISAVIDASHELAKRCFAAGDLPAARPPCTGASPPSRGRAAAPGPDPALRHRRVPRPRRGLHHPARQVQRRPGLPRLRTGDPPALQHDLKPPQLTPTQCQKVEGATG